MKIQKINDCKIRVILEYEELEANNISIHSFFSYTPATKIIIDEIINLVNKEIHFATPFDQITYDVLSLENKLFIIILSKKSLSNSIIIEFNKLDSLQNFISSLKSYIYLEKIAYSISCLNNTYSIKFDIKEKPEIWKKQFFSILSEFTCVSNSYKVK